MASIFIYLGIQPNKATNDLKTNGVIVNARIIDFLGSGQGGSGANPDYLCEFTYKNEDKRMISTSRVKERGSSYVGKTYPAIYSEKTNTLVLLMFEEDFEYYNRAYPDTLINK